MPLAELITPPKREQALADKQANWVSVELRHDRVYSTFSRMVLQARRCTVKLGVDMGSEDGVYHGKEGSVEVTH